MNKNVKNPRGGADKRHILSRKAFTLIELLVVVLIIGILAAIALPQYTKAVNKSRFVQAQTMIKSIKDAQDRYYLENTKYTDKFEDLDIGISHEKTVDCGETKCLVSSNNFGYRIFSNGLVQVMYRNDNSLNTWTGNYVWAIERYLYGGSSHPYSCIAGNDQGHSFCKSIGGKLYNDRYYDLQL
ncbi:prepilin-type N-terminal cleavage/methylation domain-containing protein [Elusimicrobium posterum]|uniref:type IV pilin protein n=1 Tax=Elusimicrobium posterum TaxID=3116653 RepID=UPI003C70800B